MDKRLELAGHSLSLKVCTGKAIGSQHAGETVYGEGYVRGAGTYLNSKREDRTTFFLKEESGGETRFTIPADFPVRDGHDIRVIYADSAIDKSRMYWIAVHNDTTGSTYVEPADVVLTSLGITWKPPSPLAKLTWLCWLLPVMVLPMYWGFCSYMPHGCRSSPDTFYLWMLCIFGAGFIIAFLALSIDPEFRIRGLKRFQTNLAEAVDIAL